MPTYDYACRACGHAWEAVQRITEDPLRDCPRCSAAAAERLISKGAGFILKGGGWYADLYAKPSSPKSESASTESKSENKSETKTETKSETKSETKAA